MTNQATVSGQNSQGLNVKSTVSTVTVPSLQAPIIEMEKGSSVLSYNGPNQSITYTYQITNKGNVTVNSLSIDDNKISANLINCLVTTLAPGATTTCTADYKTTQADVDALSITNIASASGTTRTGTPVTSMPDSVIVPAVQMPALEVVKSTSAVVVTNASQVITYSYLVKNTGNNTISSISIADNKVLTAITCVVTSLAPNTSTTCTGNYTVTQADVNSGNVTNLATASGTDPAGTPVTSPGSSVDIPVTRTQDVSLVKSANPDAFSSAGTLITYSYLVENTGNVTLNPITVSDPHNGLSAINCPVSSLDPGVSTTCTATYTTTAADVSAGFINNTGTVNAVSPIGTVQATSSLTVQGNKIPAISLSKSANVSNFDQTGDTITYYYTLVNTGNVTVTVASITDPHIDLSPIICPVLTLKPGAQTVCTAVYTITNTDIENGSISNTAQVSVNSSAGSANATSNTLTITSTGAVPLERIMLTKTANVLNYSASGTTINYSYLVQNTGTNSFTFTLTDPHPGLSAINCPVTTLSSGGQTTCTASYTTTQADVDAGSISNTAIASLGSNFQSIYTVTIPGVQSPGITLTKSSETTSFNGSNQIINYNYLVENTGNMTLNNLDITDNKITTASNITCPVTSLAPGSSTICTGVYITTQADVDASIIVNQATVSGQPSIGNVVAANSTATVNAVLTPALSVTKSTTTTSFNAPGQTLNYSFLVKNTGNSTVDTISITDDHIPTASITCPVIAIAPGASLTCIGSYTTTQADVDAGSILNSATASGQDSQATPVVSPSSTVTVFAQLTPGLDLVKSTTTVSFDQPGQSIDYSYLVTNTGNNTLSSIGITDNKIPTASISCLDTSLAPGDSTTCSATYTTTQADVDKASVTNTASSFGATPQGSAVRSANSSTAVNAVLKPGISLVKSSSTVSYQAPNQQISYSYLVTNTGNNTLSSLVIMDNKVASSQISCAATSLAPQASTTCTSVYVVSQADVDAGSVVNTATAASRDPQGGAVVSLVSSVTVNAVNSPSISLSKSTTATSFDAAGISIPYTYVVKNTGNDSLSSISIVDDKIATADITCVATTLASGTATTCTGNYITTLADVDAGVLTNSAVASGQNALGTIVLSSISDATVIATQKPAISIVKSTTTVSFDGAGQSIDYSYLVTNTGNDTLNTIKISDNRIPTANITCLATTLAPAGTTTCTGTYITTQANVDAGSVTNTATSSGKNAQGTSVTSSPSSVTVNAILSPSIGLLKSTTATSFNAAGQSILYQYLVTNTGNNTLHAIAITDDKIPTASISCSLTTLAPNATTTCTGNYIVKQSDVDSGSLTNNATSAGLSPQNTPVTSAVSTVTLNATINSGLSLVKTSTPKSYNASGVVLTYQYLVTNTGNDTISTISITDDKIATASITCQVTTLAPGVSTTCTGPYTTTQADVDAGSVSNNAIASGQNSQGATVNSPNASLTVPAVINSSLILLKSTSTGSFKAPGETINYNYLVSNTGNDTVNSLIITDDKVATASITCLVTTLAPAASTTCSGSYITTQADVDAGGVTNNATSSGTNSQGLSVTSPVSTVTVPTVINSSLSLVKSTTTVEIKAAGDVISYSYLVTNTGNDTIGSLIITDDKVATAEISCPVTSLAPAASTTCNGAYTTTQADVDAGGVTNIARSSGQNSQGALVTSPTSTVTVDAVITSGLSLVKSTTTVSFKAPGDVIDYSYVVTNTGNDTINTILVTDDKVPTANISCQATTLAPSDSTNCTGSYTTTQADVDAGGVTNNATSSGINSQGTPVTSPISTVTVNAVINSGLSLVKSSSTASFNAPGDVLAYSYLVSNTGNDTVTAISITDDKVAKADINCPVTTLAPSASTTCTGSYTTTQADVDAGSVTNNATSSAINSQGAPVTSPVSTVTVDAIINSSLNLVKSTTTTSYSFPGDSIDYHYVVTNTGNDSITNLAINDDKVSSADISCQASSLLPNASTTCLATYHVTQVDIDAGSVVNIATSTGLNSQSQAVVSNQGSATVAFVPGTGSLTLVKSANVQTYVLPGTPITYTYLLTNTGVSVLHALSITDSKLGAITCQVTTLVQGESTTCTATYTTTIEDAKKGSITNLATATGLTPNNSPVTAESSLTITLDVDQVRQKTLAAINSFLTARAQLILSVEPDRRRIINRLSQKTGACAPGAHGNIRPTATGDGVNINASASLSELCLEPSRFDVWTELHASYYRLDNLNINQRGEFGVAYLGLDYVVTPSVLAGILTEADVINQDGTAEGINGASGQGWMVGPYVSARLKPDLYLHTRAAWGRSGNKINTFGFYSDHFNTSRSLYNAELVGDWKYNKWRVSPTMGLTHYSEVQQRFTNALGVSIPGQTVNLGQVNAGPEFAYILSTNKAKEVTLRLSLQGLYNFNNSNNFLLVDNSDISPVNGLSGRMKLGAEMKALSGFSITPMVLYDGIGSNAYHSIQAQLQINFPIN